MKIPTMQVKISDGKLKQQGTLMVPLPFGPRLSRSHPPPIREQRFGWEGVVWGQPSGTIFVALALNAI